MLRIYMGQNGHMTTIGSLQEPEALGALWLDLLNPTVEEVKIGSRTSVSPSRRVTKWRKSSFRIASTMRTAPNS